MYFGTIIADVFLRLIFVPTFTFPFPFLLHSFFRILNMYILLIISFLLYLFRISYFVLVIVPYSLYLYPYFIPTVNTSIIYFIDTTLVPQYAS